MTQDVRVTRRQTLAFGAAALAFGGTPAMARYLGAGRSHGDASVVVAGNYVGGYGRDPNLLSPERPAWPSRLSAAQSGLLAPICDIVLPGTTDAPAASAVGVPAFLDEWLSAPYPEQSADRARVLPLLDRLAGEGTLAETLARLHAASDSDLLRLIGLIAGGYVTTREGAIAVGFVGDQPSAAFAGPPAEVISLLRARAAAL